MEPARGLHSSVQRWLNRSKPCQFDFFLHQMSLLMFRKHWIVPFLILIPVLRIFAMEASNSDVGQELEKSSANTDVIMVE